MSTKFLNVVLRDKNVGAISSSSNFLVQRVIGMLGTEKLDLIIEYGAGDGVMTKALLKALSPAGKIYVVEANADFVKTLREIHDARLVVLHGKVQDIDATFKQYDIREADLVISSIPFSWFTNDEREDLMRKSNALLRTGGDIIFFHQYVPIAYFHMKKYFKRARIYFEAKNILPCFIATAKK
jgi:phospholipid N-methyltransferase